MSLGEFMRLVLLFALASLSAFAQSKDPFFFSTSPKLDGPCTAPRTGTRLAPFDFCKPGQLKVGAAVVAPAPKASAVCSVPLLQVPAVETHDRMVVPAPPASGKFAAQAPAPPCGKPGK